MPGRAMEESIFLCSAKKERDRLFFGPADEEAALIPNRSVWAISIIFFQSSRTLWEAGKSLFFYRRWNPLEQNKKKVGPLNFIGSATAARVTAVCFFWHTDERVFLSRQLSHVPLFWFGPPFFLWNRKGSALSPSAITIIVWHLRGWTFGTNDRLPVRGTKCRNEEETNQKGGDLKG